MRETKENNFLPTLQRKENLQTKNRTYLEINTPLDLRSQPPFFCRSETRENVIARSYVPAQ